MQQSSDVAFVAGATGYTGKAVVERLARRGVRVHAHVRPDSSSLPAWRSRFEAMGAVVDTTPWSADEMGESLRRIAPTVVFSLLGTTRARAKTEGLGATEGYEKIDYGLTALLIDAAATCEPKPRFVYLSAAGVGPDSGNPYIAVRWRAEERLRASGLPFTIARPSFITGADREESRPMERLAAKVGDGALALVGAFGGHRTRDRYRSLTAAQLADGLVRAAFDDTARDAVLYAERLR